MQALFLKQMRRLPAMPAVLSWRGLRNLMDGVPGALLGGAVFGAWAAAVNWDAGGALAARAGLLHWFLSAMLTYSGTAAMRRFFGRPKTAMRGLIRACIGGLSLTYAVLLAAHSALGTPHLALTLAAGIVPNLAFCLTYSILLARTLPLGPSNPAIQPGAHHG